MTDLNQRIQQAFGLSRKLSQLKPSSEQLANVEARLQQIFTPEEIAKMDERTLARQVERVWPIAQYVDRKA